MTEALISCVPLFRRCAALMISLIGLLLGAVLSATVSVTPAAAATIQDAITSVTVDNVHPNPGGRVTTTMTFTLPAGTHPGDTFRLALPAQLSGFRTQFQLKDPQGHVVATAVITGTPAIATFTVTDYALTHLNVTGSAYFSGYLNTSGYASTTQVLTYTGGGSTYQIPVTVGSGHTPDRSHARKTGSFSRPDQGLTVPQTALTWRLESPVGPAKSGTMVDDIVDGQSAVASSVVVWIGDATGPGGELAHGVRFPGATVTVTPRRVAITFGALPAGKMLQLVFRTSLDRTQPGGTGFSNAATVRTVGTAGTVRTDQVSASVRSATAGGNANGALIPPPSTVTTTTSSVVTTTATPPTTLIPPPKTTTGTPPVVTTTSITTATPPTVTTPLTGPPVITTVFPPAVTTPSIPSTAPTAPAPPLTGGTTTPTVPVTTTTATTGPPDRTIPTTPTESTRPTAPTAQPPGTPRTPPLASTGFSPLPLLVFAGLGIAGGLALLRPRRTGSRRH